MLMPMCCGQNSIKAMRCTAVVADLHHSTFQMQLRGVLGSRVLVFILLLELQMGLRMALASQLERNIAVRKSMRIYENQQFIM